MVGCDGCVSCVGCVGCVGLGVRGGGVGEGMAVGGGVRYWIWRVAHVPAGK